MAALLQLNVNKLIDGLSQDTSPPTEAEVKNAIKAMKSGKAPGVDSIHAEMLKADLSTATRVLTNLFDTIWDIWKSNQYTTKTKIRLYNSNVKSILLYGSECWRVVKGDMAKIDAFHNRCLRKIC
ncbi:hypothetical protein NP493_101g09048 [Ridgeia piscesae]|uniref:DUF6451 domain-containing protein n=1 Tax=Ridgeia piscesae TaxID=27915 RepID=A0AAD9P7Z0_RIDPI|nr:hypothetical protein NP493_101g09048 [Ridgeia piscesae]